MPSLKRLAGPAQVSNAAATKYTAPAAGAIVRHVRVSNPSGSPVTFTLSVGADAAGTRLFDAFSVPVELQLPNLRCGVIAIWTIDPGTSLEAH